MRWKNDGERKGMDTEVLAGLTNRFPPSDSILELNLVCPKVLQDVSCRNSKLPVENTVFIKEAERAETKQDKKKAKTEHEEAS